LRAIRIFALLAAAACGGGDVDAPVDCGPNGECPTGYTCETASHHCVKTGVITTPDAPLPDAPPPDAPACVVGSGPTMHSGSLGASATWTAAQSPHVLTSDFEIVGATLTLEPCVEVRIAAKHVVSVGTGGKLIAVGNVLQGIHITSSAAGQPFANLRTVGGGTMQLGYVTIDGGGDPLNSLPAVAGMIMLQGVDQTMPTQATLAVDHVELAGSASNGIVMIDGAGFAPGSTALTIGTSAGWPVSMWARAAGTLPDGVYTGNGKDEVVFSSGNGYGAVQEDMTLHDRGVPYRVGDGVGAPQLHVDAPNGSSKLVTLTIEPGVTLRFVKNGQMIVQSFVGTNPALGALKAVGTADKPIVFTSAATTPAAGDWEGLWFGQVPDASDRIDHARFEYAGANSSSGSSACPTTFGTISNDAAVRLLGPPASAFITNTTFAHSAGHGIDRGWRADNLTDFLATNTFQDIMWCDESYPSAANGSCPAPSATPCPR
jgi:hypothetical protein